MFGVKLKIPCYARKTLSFQLRAVMSKNPRERKKKKRKIGAKKNWKKNREVL